MARPQSSYMPEAPPGYRWKTVTKINAMGRPYTTRILVPVDTLEPTQPTQVPQPQTAAGIFDDVGYEQMITDAFPGGYPGQATTPQPATPPDWRDSFVGRAPPMAKKKDITTVIKKSEDPGVATTETITIKGGLLGEDDVPTGQDDPQDERGMGMWNAEMAQLRARQQQGTAAPTQQAVEAALGRYGDVRRSQFTPPPQYPSQASGALPTPPQPDPRFQRMKPGQMMGMVDPSWSAAVPGSNVPPRVSRAMTGYPPHASGAVPPQPARLPLAHGQDDPTGAAYGGRFETGSSDAVIRGMIEEGARQGRVSERAMAGVPARGEFDHLAVQPTSREMIVEASKKPLYVTDDGEPIYMEDVVAVGGVARLRAISRAPRQAQEEFFKWIKRIKDSRHRSGKPPITADKPIVKTTLGGGALGVAEYARRGIFRGEGEQPEGEQAVAPRVREPGDVKPTRRFPEEVIAAAQARQGDAQTPLPDRFPEEVIAAGQARQRDTQTPFPNRFPQEVFDRRKGIQQTPFMGEGEASSQVAMSPTLPSGREELQIPREVTEGWTGSFPATKVSNNEQIAANPNLEKIWGKFAYDPAARKKYFLDGMKDIYKKAMLLNLIAVMTGGESQAAAFIEAKTAELEMIDKFDEEERITNIWREVFTDANGNPYMPKDKREAAERAGKTGARPAVIKDIFGAVPDVKKRDQYFRVNPNDKTKWEIIRPEEDPGEGWVRGTPTARAPLSDKDIYMERFEDWQKLEKTNPELAKAYGRMIGAVEKDPKGVSPSRWTSILQGDIQGSDPTIQLPEGETATSFIMKWLTQPEVEYIDPISGDAKKMPGYSGLTGQTATEAEIAEATGATTATEATTEKARTEAPQGAIDALMANPTEEMKKMFKDKYGYLPEGI